MLNQLYTNHPILANFLSEHLVEPVTRIAKMCGFNVMTIDDTLNSIDLDVERLLIDPRLIILDENLCALRRRLDLTYERIMSSDTANRVDPQVEDTGGDRTL